jgi:transposase
MTKKKVGVVRVGIDVGASELVVVIRKNGTTRKARSFANTAADHARLIRALAPFPDVIVCLEATGLYHLDLAVALHDAGLSVMVLNPKVSHHFAKVLLKHSKTDAVDADTLAQYAERMPYQAWTRPDNAVLSLRLYARRINALTHQKVMAKNQRHALSVTQGTPEAVARDVALAIAQLEARIKVLSREARAFIDAQASLRQPLAWLMTIKGVAQASAIALLGELLLLPPGLTPKQWVKFAGLDPKHFRSGTSVDKRARISKAGNRYIRQALYMPALSAKAHDPYVKGFFEHLLAAGKTKMQAVCAVMRKLLHAMHGMLTHRQPFDNTRFYAVPAGA